MPEHKYACGSDHTFTAEDVAADRQPTREVLEAVEKLRGAMDGPSLPENGWIEVDGDGNTVTLIAPLREAFASVTFEDRGGKWDPSGWGDCVPRLQVPNRSVLRWAFTNASYPPSPDAMDLEVLVSEVDCSSGRDIKGLIESTISYQEERITVLLTAPGLTGSQNCLGRAPTS
jgi:hypothetical protein